jgi:hypothetical protein
MDAPHAASTADDSDDEAFVYPGTEEQQPQEEHHPVEDSPSERVPDVVDHASQEPEPEDHGHESAVAPQPQPSPAQLEALFASSSSGDLNQLKSLFRNAQESASVEPFALANDASSRTGLTALHAAASRGYLDIVSWCKFEGVLTLHHIDTLPVIKDCGAMPDIEDREGEVRAQ